MEYRGITSIPQEWDDWYDLVRATVQAAVATFGVTEVRKWSFGKMMHMIVFGLY